VTYESDLETARDQLEAAAREIDAVIQGGPAIRIGSARYPAAPTCYIREFGDSEVVLRLRFWAQEPYRQTPVRSAVLTNVWRRFDDHGIEIPYPHRHLVFDDTSGELNVGMRDRLDGPQSRSGGAPQREEGRPPEDPESGGTRPRPQGGGSSTAEDAEAGAGGGAGTDDGSAPGEE